MGLFWMHFHCGEGREKKNLLRISSLLFNSCSSVLCQKILFFSFPSAATYPPVSSFNKSASDWFHWSRGSSIQRDDFVYQHPPSFPPSLCSLLCRNSVTLQLSCESVCAAGWLSFTPLLLSLAFSFFPLHLSTPFSPCPNFPPHPFRCSCSFFVCSPPLICLLHT